MELEVGSETHESDTNSSNYATPDKFKLCNSFQLKTLQCGGDLPAFMQHVEGQVVLKTASASPEKRTPVLEARPILVSGNQETLNL